MMIYIAFLSNNGTPEGVTFEGEGNLNEEQIFETAMQALRFKHQDTSINEDDVHLIEVWKTLSKVHRAY